MKKTMLTLSFIVVTCTLKAQVLYGTTFRGGNNNSGTICKLVTATNTLTAAFSFDAVDGANPEYSKLLQALDGKLYGMTSEGGSKGAGTIFSYNPDASYYTQLKEFDFDYANGALGAYPQGSLIQASDDKLYGMTTAGGDNDRGVIFSYDPVTSAYTKLKDFDGTNGGLPYGSLVQASDGKLYGMTKSGGSGIYYGVIFSYDPSTSTYIKLIDFDGTNGGLSYGSLVQASDGKLYGMTSYGGSNGSGVIFSYDPATSTYSRLKDFDYTNGAYPYGDLVQASDGKLYGMTTSGGSSDVGVIFSYDPSTSTYTKLKDFDGKNGSTPLGSLIRTSDGKLYGMTSEGGSSEQGVIFSYDPATSTYTKLKDLNYTNGAYPKGSLVQASDGNLYGMTRDGGSVGYGVIFSYDLAASTYTKLRDFSTNNTGNYMAGALIKDQKNKLYGMASQGGGYGVGTIFSYDANTLIFTKLQDFDNANGASPYGSLVQASDEKLYGMTREGGSSGYGIIFSYDPATSIYTKLIDFDGTNGAAPYGSLIQAFDGKLYGTAGGGSSDNGVIFSFDPVTSTYAKLIDFDWTNGIYPSGSLVQASDGKLYGMTAAGGDNEYGVVFSYDPATSVYTRLKDFDGTNGGMPRGSLVQASDGKLYGMTGGGIFDYGVIFSFDLVTSTYTKLVVFDYTNGCYPWGSLVQASDGNLYGMTAGGGSTGYGVAFSYDPATSTYTKLSDFNGDNGSSPQYTSFIEIPCTTTTYHPDADSDGFGDADSSLHLCEPKDGYVTDSSDCNDSNAAVHPGATEICNGTDDNCNGEIDEGCTAGDVQISILDKSVIEGNQDRKFIFIPVILSEKFPKKIIRVKYTTQNNTAKAGSDYVAQSGTLVFLPGLKKTILPIRIKGDKTPEANETFRIILSDPVNATIADSTGVITILDDDASTSNAEQKDIKTICSITLSPNPVQDKVKIMLTGYSGNVTIQLSSFDGRILQQQKLQAFSAKSAQQQMNVGSYANGTYLVTAIDEKGNRQTERLVVDR